MEAEVLIRKQKITLRTANEQQALRMRMLMNDVLQQKLTAVLESVFEPSASAMLYVNIDKISIDVGQLQETGFEKNFTKLVETKLTQELRRLLEVYMDPVHTQAQQPNDFYEGSGGGAPFLQLNPKADHELNALVYFLEQGIYPWWYPRADQKTPAQLLKICLDTDVSALLLQLISLKKRRSPESLDRIVLRLFTFLTPSAYMQFTNGLMELYHQPALSNNTEVIVKNADQLSAAFSLTLSAFHTRLFGFILRNNESDTENFLLNFFRKLISDQQLSLNEWIRKQQAMSLVPEINDLINQIINEYEKVGRPKQKGAENHLPTDDDRVVEKGVKNGFPSGVVNGNEQGELISRTESKHSGKSYENEIIEQGIYIGNAGLLLLHPFLSYFFADANLLTSSHQFISEKAQCKAAVLLYYLQSGETEYKEWDMAFNKLLCGLNQQTVLPAGITLSAADMENSEILLKAVVQHWEALKGSGIAALRNTFLLREGKISRKDDHWLIQVERTGADVLLDRLPWGLSTVKLPWLDQLIFTEW